MRIVSLVPSWSEWLVDLGVAPVGVTKFCVHPPELRSRATRIGGTKQVDVDAVHALKPDLVVACKEENVREQVEAMQVPVLVTDPCDVEGAWAEMQRIADAVGKAAEGAEWIGRIQAAWEAPRAPEFRVAYAIWREPWMVAGGGTYIDAVLRWWGLENAFADVPRYRETEGWRGADAVLLSSEPYPFRAVHVAELEATGQPALAVNGEAFSWYGSRMLHAVNDLRKVSGQIHSTLSRKT